MGRHILYYHRAGSNNGTIANRNTRKNRRMSSNPHIVSYSDGEPINILCAALWL